MALHSSTCILAWCHHEKCWAGGVTNWNQDEQEKHQQPQICRRYHSKGRKQRGIKSLLMKVKEESEKASLKLNIKKTMIMQSDPIISWELDGEKVEAVTDFLFFGSKITVDCHWRHVIRR